MNKKTLYILLAIIGFLGPNYFVVLQTMETGNVMFYGNIPETLQLMFANNISTAFIVDLVICVLIFFIWMTMEARKLQVPHFWLYYIMTMAFGLAFAWPLFMLAREKRLGAPAA